MTDLMSSPEGVIECLYAAITFQAGQKPNYNLMNALFHPDGRVTPPASDTGDERKSMSVKEFVRHFDSRIQDLIPVGGSEKQIDSMTVKFKGIAHVFSIYHFYAGDSAEPLARGVNSFQLIFENGRWWILSLTWDRAAAGEMLPAFS